MQSKACNHWMGIVPAFNQMYTLLMDCQPLMRKRF